MFRSILLISFLAMAASPVVQAQTTFTFDGSIHNTASFSQTVGGITISCSNPNSFSGRFAADVDGLLLSDDRNLGADSFQFSFDQSVTVSSYTIGFVLDPTAGAFALSRPGLTSTGNSLSQVGTFAINGTFTASAGQVITLTSNPSGDPGWSQLKSFTVTAVPEPVTSFGVAGALGACTLLIRRRRGSAGR